MGVGVDRKELHRYLWSKARRDGSLQINNQELAAALVVSEFTMSRIVHEFLDSGALRRIGIGYGNVRTYVVTDPDQFYAKEDHHA